MRHLSRIFSLAGLLSIALAIMALTSGEAGDIAWVRAGAFGGLAVALFWGAAAVSGRR